MNLVNLKPSHSTVIGIGVSDVVLKNTPSFKDVNNIELSFVVIDMLNNSSNEKYLDY